MFKATLTNKLKLTDNSTPGTITRTLGNPSNARDDIVGGKLSRSNIMLAFIAEHRTCLLTNF